ncbi:MAG TPA: thioredoxin family protein [Thermotogota bacterium]|nr:thioredoxin family protein [Thermotogota bacterium]
MGLLKKKDQVQIKDRLAEEMKDNVKIILFLTEDESKCHYCTLTKEVLQEVASLSEGKLEIEEHIYEQDQELAKKYGVEYLPGFVILDKNLKHYNVIFHGAPFGHEFATLLEDIVIISNGANPPVSQDIVEKLKAINKPVKIQAFVTPTCPYCPKAVLTAHYFSMINPEFIKGEMVEASEFPELSAKYGVSSVPQMVINDGANSFVGAFPEREYLDEVLKVL